MSEMKVALKGLTVRERLRIRFLSFLKRRRFPSICCGRK